MDYSLPGFSLHGISQARILDWVAISVSRDFPDPGIKPESPPLAGGFFTTEAPGKPKAIILPMGGKKKKKERKEKQRKRTNQKADIGRVYLKVMIQLHAVLKNSFQIYPSRWVENERMEGDTM